MFSIGLTDHLEGPVQRPSIDVFNEVSELVRLADDLGVEYAWFAEHHAHLHFGHLPTPLLFALHLAGQTKRIKLGTAIICLNLHHPLDVAEQVAVADLLAGGRLAPGFGSGSTPEEVELFGLEELGETERHVHFEKALRSILREWAVRNPEKDYGHPSPSPGTPGEGWGEGSLVRALERDPLQEYRARGKEAPFLPKVAADLPKRCWVAVNSIGSARIAGRIGFNMLFSHLRTPLQYREFVRA